MKLIVSSEFGAVTASRLTPDGRVLQAAALDRECVIEGPGHWTLRVVVSRTSTTEVARLRVVSDAAWDLEDPKGIFRVRPEGRFIAAAYVVPPPSLSAAPTICHTFVDPTPTGYRVATHQPPYIREIAERPTLDEAVQTAVDDAQDRDMSYVFMSGRICEYVDGAGVRHVIRARPSYDGTATLWDIPLGGNGGTPLGTFPVTTAEQRVEVLRRILGLLADKAMGGGPPAWWFCRGS